MKRSALWLVALLCVLMAFLDILAIRTPRFQSEPFDIEHFAAYVSLVVLNLIAAGCTVMVCYGDIRRWRLRHKRYRLARRIEIQFERSKRAPYREAAYGAPLMLVHLRVESLPDSVRREDLETLRALDEKIVALEISRIAQSS